MRREIIANLKKLTALILSAAMTFSMNSSAFANELILESGDSYVEEYVPEAEEYAGDTLSDIVVDEFDEVGSSYEELLTDEETLLDGETLIEDEAVIEENQESEEESDITENDIIENVSEEEAGEEPERTLEDYLRLKYDGYNIEYDKSGRVTNISKNGTNVTTVTIDGSDCGGYANTINKGKDEGNFDQFHNIQYMTNVKDLTITGISDFNHIYFPDNMEKFTLSNTIANCFEVVHAFSGTSSNEIGRIALKELNMDFTMGDRYWTESVSHPYWFSKEMKVNLAASDSSLERLNIKVKFLRDDQVFIIDAGNNSFPNLTSANCNISVDPSGANGILTITNVDNCNLLKTSEYAQGTVKISCKQLIDSISNQYPQYYGKTVYSQDDIENITELTIDKTTTNNNLITLNDLSELGNFTSLKKLKITGDGGNPVIKSIDFPSSIEELEMKNAVIAPEALEDSEGNKNTSAGGEGNIFKLPATKKVVFTNMISQDSEAHHFMLLDLVIDDANGIVESVQIDRSSFKSVLLKNGQSTSRALTMSAYQCSKLEEVILNGYKLTGSADFEDCSALVHLGTKNPAKENEWTIYGDFGSSESAELNLNNCTMLGRREEPTSENLTAGTITIDYPFTEGKLLSLDVFNTASIGEDLIDNDSNKNRVPSKLCFTDKLQTDGGRVNIYCSDNSWIYNTYKDRESENYYIANSESDVPDIAVFPLGNKLISDYETSADEIYIPHDDDDDYVSRWDMCLRLTDSANRLDQLKFYVKASNGRTRKVSSYDNSNLRFVVLDKDGNAVDGSVLEYPNSVFDNSGHPRIKKPGRYKIEARRQSDGVLIGYVYVQIYDSVSEVSLKAYRGDKQIPLDKVGTSVSNPAYVEYGNITFRATKTPNTEVPEDTHWEFFRFTDIESKDWDVLEEYDLSWKKSNRYMITSNAGISVVSTREHYKPEGEDKYVNERTYNFPKETNTSGVYDDGRIKLFVFDPLTGTKNLVGQNVYLQIKDACKIAVNGTTIDNDETLNPTTYAGEIIQGMKGKNYAKIKISNIADPDTLSVKILEDEYKDLLKVKYIAAESNMDDSVAMKDRTAVYKIELNTQGKTEKGLRDAILKIKKSGSWYFTAEVQADYGVHKLPMSLKTVLYYINYDLAGGHLKSGVTNPDRRIKGYSGTIKFNKPERTGYDFKGWTCAGLLNDKGKSPNPNLTIGSKEEYKDYKLVAKWTLHKYTNTLKYNANGGTGAPADKKVTVTYPNTQSKITVATTKPKRTGYTFKGWYTAKTGGTKVGKTYTLGSNKKAANQTVTLYARWAVNKYTIKYNANGGKGSMKSKSMTYDKKAKLTKNSFSRKGYSFLGWSTNKKATKAKYKNLAEVKNLTSKSGGTVTLYAIWKKK